jgi:SAM-dependent methyltransferase
MTPEPAPSWTRDTVVRLGSGTRLDLRATQLVVEVKGERHAFPRATLDLLAFFEAPRSLQEGLDHLARQAKGRAGLAEAFARLVKLCELGVLEAPGAVPVALRAEEGSFGPPAQIRMLEDRARTSAFLEAIRRTVRPGDVVLDLGTGSGILALAAAQAGARHVYAIESQPIAEAAARLFAASPWADRITLLRGHSLDLELPEQADVLVSEIIGHDPLGENILEVTADAVKRLLKPGARLIPSGLRIFATPVEVPERERSAAYFTSAVLARWSRCYGLELSALSEETDSTGAPPALRRCLVTYRKALRWRRLGPSGEISLYDLRVTVGSEAAVEAVVAMDKDGQLGGILVHFVADLSPGLTLGTSPEAHAKGTHWKMPVFLLPSGRLVEPGTLLSLNGRLTKGRLGLSRP